MHQVQNKILIVTVAISAIGLTACGQRVKPGYVGIPVSQYGSNAGVQTQVLGVGSYYEPWGTTIYEYPVFTNTYTYTKNEKEGSGANEEFQFQDKTGLALESDIGVSYSADPSRVAILFQKYRVDTDQIVSGPLRNEIRDALIKRASGLNIDEINGPGRAQLLANVQSDVQAYFAPVGLRVERLFWAGNVRMPANVLEQINARIANEQHALAAQAQVATVKAEADQTVAEAQGKAQALDAEGAAIRANPEVLRIRAIEKWDGKLPQVTSGATPFIDINK